MKRMTPILVALLAVTVLPAVAQELTLTVPVTATKPTIDGTIGSGEYGTPLVVGKTTLAVARSADTLSIAVTADTQGWVAVGLGSSRMDAATIFMGYVADGKLQLKTLAGRGHSHSDVASDAILASAGKEQNGKTTMEIALKPQAFIAAGQTELLFIVAYGNTDSFISMHAARWNGTARLTNQ